MVNKIKILMCSLFMVFILALSMPMIISIYVIGTWTKIACLAALLFGSFYFILNKIEVLINRDLRLIEIKRLD